MKPRLILALLAACALSGCNPQQIHRACVDAIRGAQASQDAAAWIVATFHISPEKAADLARYRDKGEEGIRLICEALDPPAPVAVPGQ